MYSGSVAATGSAVSRGLGPGHRLAPVQVASGVGQGGGRLRPRRMTQCSGWWRARAMARSTIGLYSTMRLTLDAARGREHDLRCGLPSIRVASSAAREAAEHHRVHRADPRAGQHRDRCLGNHRQVDGDPVALGHPEATQGTAGEPGNLIQQRGVGVCPLGTGHRAVVDQRGRLAPAVTHVPVQRVEAGVEDPVGEPAVKRGVRGVKHRGGCLVPVDLLGCLTPEIVGIGQAPVEHFRVAAHRDTPFSLVPGWRGRTIPFPAACTSGSCPSRFSAALR